LILWSTDIWVKLGPITLPMLPKNSTAPIAVSWYFSGKESTANRV
jgi:hypothetical protein